MHSHMGNFFLHMSIRPLDRRLLRFKVEFKDVHGSKVSFLCVFMKKITYGPSNFARNSEEPFWSGPIDAYADEIKAPQICREIF